MYPVSDDDLQFLESYLDDALSDQELANLRTRLSREADLAAALRMLREERSQRQTFFQAIDPTPKEVESLVASIHQSANRRRWWQDSRRLVSYGSALAACLAIAAVGGFFYHAAGKEPLQANDGAVSAVETIATPVNYPVDVTDDYGHVIAVQHFNNARDAEDFARDLHRAQDRRKQSNGGVMLIENHDF